MEEVISMMQKDTFQNIYNEISKFLPEKWEEIVIYLEYGDDAYSYTFYVKINGKYINGFNIPGVSTEQVYDSFKQIDRIILSDRRETKDRLWTNMTMIISADGIIHTDFDYTDLTEGAYKYKKAWKAKYLH